MIIRELLINMLMLKTLSLFPKSLSFGLVEEYVYYILIFIGIIISYLLVRPFITWFVTLKSTRLLSYIISSLIILLILFIATNSIEELNHLLFNIFRVGLQCLAVFGVLLLMFHGFQRINRKT